MIVVAGASAAGRDICPSCAGAGGRRRRQHWPETVLGVLVLLLALGAGLCAYRYWPLLVGSDRLAAAYALGAVATLLVYPARVQSRLVQALLFLSYTGAIAVVGLVAYALLLS